MKKLKPLTIEEHIILSQDMIKAQEILEPWLERLWQAYGVKCKDAAQLFTVLNLLSSKMCCQLDNRWHECVRFSEDPYFDHRSPYYGTGKRAYS